MYKSNIGNFYGDKKFQFVGVIVKRNYIRLFLLNKDLKNL